MSTPGDGWCLVCNTLRYYLLPQPFFFLTLSGTSWRAQHKGTESTCNGVRKGTYGRKDLRSVVTRESKAGEKSKVTKRNTHDRPLPSFFITEFSLQMLSRMMM